MKRLFALFFVALVVVGVIRSIDAIALSERGAPAPADAAAPGARELHHPGSGRLFVLMVDSLRYATATDPLRMPYLAGMRARSTHAKTLSSRDAVTVSALRAAFTGRDGFSVLGFVKNYWRGDAEIESLFRQAAGLGVRTAIYSDGSFDQFGAMNAAYADHEVGDGDEEDRQNRGAEAALADFVSGEHDLVVFHLTYSDHAAHAHGVASRKYEHAFASVDTLIARIDLQIPPDDTFLVMGDHGHDVEGRHALGLDIPTFTAYRGPGFGRGVDLGVTSIVEHRYFASWALGLPLDPSYRGGRHPSALVALPGDVTPAAFRVAFDPLASSRDGHDGGVPPAERASFVALMVYVGLLAGIFAVYARALSGWPPAAPRALGEGGLAPWMHVWAAAATAPLFAPGERPRSAIVGAVLAGSWLVLASKGSRPAQRVALFVAPPLATLALTLWGYELAQHRVDVHEPLIADLETLWEIAAVTGALLTLLFGAMRVAWGLLAVTAVLFYPTVYRYGAPGTMTLVWCSWLLFLGVEHVGAEARLHRAGPRLGRLADAARNLLPGAVAAALLLPFSFPSANNFRFVGWAGEYAIDDATTWFALALVANLIVFVRVRAGASVIAAGLAGVALVTGLETWPSIATGARGALLTGSLALVAAGLAWAARRRPSPTLSGLGRIAALACLEAASFYVVRVPVEAHRMADAAFAALTLTAVFVGRLPESGERTARQTFLLLLGVLASGWATLAWTAHRLEWTVLYEWLPAELVEKHVGLLSPLLLGRYAIPLLSARVILRERFGDGGHATSRALALSAAKILCLAAVLAGIGYVSALSNVYIEAVEEAAIFVLLAVGFLPSSARSNEMCRSSRTPSPASV